VAATFRKNLILAEEPCYAGCLVFAHGTHHVVHVSVPRVRVGENGMSTAFTRFRYWCTISVMVRSPMSGFPRREAETL
jgi:hypothetical protein